MRIRLAVVVLLALSLPAVSQSPSKLDDIRSRGVLRVGTTGDYAPFTLRTGEPVKFTGFDIEQALALGKTLGVAVVFVETSWSSLAADLLADRFDVAMGGVSVTADRAEKGAFSVPYLQDGKTPIARCADAGRFDTIAQIDRPQVRVVVNPGGTNERFARKNFPAAQIAVVADNRRVFDEIVEGRADVMVTDAVEARLQAKRHPAVLCAAHPDAPFETGQKAYWFGKDEPLRKSIDAWLASSKNDGSFAERLKRWLD